MPAASSPAPVAAPRLFDVDEYYAMAEDAGLGPEARVHVYRRLGSEGYATRSAHPRGDALRAEALPGDVPPRPVEAVLGP